MGKKIFSVVVAIVFAMSLLYFANAPKENRVAADDMIGARMPVISIEGLQFWKYRNADVSWKLSAQSAVFISPNQLELLGRVRYEKPSATKYESLSCEKAQFIFETDGLLSIKSDAQLREILAEEDVLMQNGDYTIATKSARYSSMESTILSDDPVQVESGNQRFEGEEGFVYEIGKGILNMRGDVRGEIVR
jgi:hypothetical protein